MAILTTDRKITKRGHFGGLGSGPVKAGIVLPHGRPVFVDAATGLMTNTPNAGANKFAGMAHLRCDNSGGADGDADVEYHTRDPFEYPFDVLTQADVGKKAYTTGNDEFTVTAVGGTYVGTVSEFINGTLGEVSIDTQAA